jgi:hypothetical protein
MSKKGLLVHITSNHHCGGFQPLRVAETSREVPAEFPTGQKIPTKSTLTLTPPDQGSFMKRQRSSQQHIEMM